MILKKFHNIGPIFCWQNRKYFKEKFQLFWRNLIGQKGEIIANVKDFSVFCVHYKKDIFKKGFNYFEEIRNNFQSERLFSILCALSHLCRALCEESPGSQGRKLFGNFNRSKYARLSR